MTGDCVRGVALIINSHICVGTCCTPSADVNRPPGHVDNDQLNTTKVHSDPMNWGDGSVIMTVNVYNKITQVPLVYQITV